MATLWAYRTDPGQGLRAILEGGRVEWQWGADRGWATLAEIELAAKVHASPAVVEALRSLLEWARTDLARQGLVRECRADLARHGLDVVEGSEHVLMRLYFDRLDSLYAHRRGVRWEVDADMISHLSRSEVTA